MIFERLRRWLGLAGPADQGSGQRPEEAMVSCQEALERIYEYMDGELDHVSHTQIEEHFRVCARCFPHLRLERNFRARVQAALSKPEVPGDLRQRVLDLLARESPGE